ncbi:hypothetical protein EVG20_g8384 [Dentipellis fragilis]|uniref:Uncharacterized protein n=1 Tax=Dentipellis fragilis TaxID=205917 RepID=A0A4Y9Y7S8_9AGAM|nr:hypothetical protein EVG20_g8384 [Dentipellis fragilis]
MGPVISWFCVHPKGTLCAHDTLFGLDFAGDSSAVAELSYEDKPAPDVPEVEPEVLSRTVPVQVDED